MMAFQGVAMRIMESLAEAWGEGGADPLGAGPRDMETPDQFAVRILVRKIAEREIRGDTLVVAQDIGAFLAAEAMRKALIGGYFMPDPSGKVFLHFMGMRVVNGDVSFAEGRNE